MDITISSIGGGKGGGRAEKSMFQNMNNRNKRKDMIKRKDN